MKILVIQITRPGDIFCTTPVLAALARKYSGAEIHLMVRKKFAAAVKPIPWADHVWEMDTEKWIKPLLEDSTDFGPSIGELSQFIASLKQEKFDQVINLSFSPSSSFITHLISDENTEVRGYTRTSDFYLHIRDEASLYFKAHVGVGKSNRIHVIDLFAMVANCELKSEDFITYSFSQKKPSISSAEKIACHLGASQDFKTWPMAHWAELISKIIAHGHPVILVGGKDDLERAEFIVKNVNGNITNLVGQTSFPELARVLSQSELFIGADSGPMHVADSVGCRTLNLSIGDVNFWETGPVTKGSHVLVSPVSHDLMSQKVFSEFLVMTKWQSNESQSIVCDGEKPLRFDDRRLLAEKSPADLGWSTLMWLTFGGEKPVLSKSQNEIVTKMNELSDIVISQIKKFEKDRTYTRALKMIVNTDSILAEIKSLDPVLAPLVDHFICRKENIPPADQDQIIRETLASFDWLKTQTGVWSEKMFAPEREVFL